MYYRVTAPDGKNHRFSCLYHFCDKYNLRYREVLHLVNDEKLDYKGWRNGWNQGVYEPEPDIKISESVIKRMCKLYPSCTLREIASRLGISVHTVVKYLKREGVYVANPNYKRVTEEQAEEILSLYPQLTPTEIGNKLGITHRTAVRYLKQADVYVPKRPRREGVYARNIKPMEFHGHY